MENNRTYKTPPHHFEPSSISPCQVNTLMAAALDGVRELFDRPGEEERFQDWLKKKGLTETPYDQSVRKKGG